MRSSPRTPRVLWLDRVSHASAVEQMEDRRRAIAAGDLEAEAVLLCEHDPVVTYGRSADRANLKMTESQLAARGVTLAAASRGGDFTYHGPGQLMIYPVVRLRHGLIRYLECVASAIADVAAELGVRGAQWRRNPAGVWLDDRKLAACGVHVRRGVTVHGFALNVSTPPGAWDVVVPCGLTTASGSPVVSLADRLGDACPGVGTVAAALGPVIGRALSR